MKRLLRVRNQSAFLEVLHDVRYEDGMYGVGERTMSMSKPYIGVSMIVDH
jgi:hypothetical protein